MLDQLKAAIKQCYERNYAAAFVHDPRPVYYVGVNYSPSKNIRTPRILSRYRASGLVVT